MYGHPPPPPFYPPPPPHEYHHFHSASSPSPDAYNHHQQSSSYCYQQHPNFYAQRPMYGEDNVNAHQQYLAEEAAQSQQQQPQQQHQERQQQQQPPTASSASSSSYTPTPSSSAGSSAAPIRHERRSKAASASAAASATGGAVGFGGPGSNKKERRRTQSINNAYANLRDCIPNVPCDTKLSKIKTLRLATSYIDYLMMLLNTENKPGVLIEGFKVDIHKKWNEKTEDQKRRELVRTIRLLYGSPWESAPQPSNFAGEARLASSISRLGTKHRNLFILSLLHRQST